MGSSSIRLRVRVTGLALGVLGCLLLAAPAGAVTAVPTKPLKIKPVTLKMATATVPYVAHVGATGGTPAYSFTVQSGSLPEGLTLSPSGEISGTATTAGSSTFTVQASDESNPVQTATQTYTLTVQLDVAPKSLGRLTALGTIRRNLTAAGGSGSYSFSIVSGELPETIELFDEPGFHVINGTPYNTGPYSVTVQAKDESTGLTGIRTYQGVVALGISPSSGPFPEGIVGKSYFATFNASGGSGEYTYEITEGKLPEGLELGREQTSATISGTPTTAETQKIAVRATDTQTGLTSRAKYTIAISPFAFPKGVDTLEEKGIEGGFRGRDTVVFEMQHERKGVATGTMYDSDGSTGKWSLNVATTKLTFTWPEVNGSEGFLYQGTCDLAKEECTGTQPFGTFLLTR